MTKEKPNPEAEFHLLGNSLLALWLLLSTLWVIWAATYTDVGIAVQAYKNVLWYENAISYGQQSETMRMGYLAAAQYTETVSRYLRAFIFLGLFPPLVVLIGGSWIYRRLKDRVLRLKKTPVGKKTH